MILYLLNKSFEKTNIIDTFTSVIWTSRYQEASEFELYLPYQKSIVFEIGQMLQREDNDTLMKIENIQLVTDEENGDYYTVTGTSIEKMLSDRIVWDTTELFGSVEESIYRLIDENMIHPDDKNRIIDNFRCAPLKMLPETGNFIFHGESLYDVVTSVCQTYGYGFKLTNDLIFEIYKGADRSYNQTENPYVIFSPDFDNVLQTTYKNEIVEYKNTCLVYGKSGNGPLKMMFGNYAGASRRETFVDAGDVDSNETFKSKAEKTLTHKSANETFECEIQPSYVYGKDYCLGDIVQIENEYKMHATARIMEIIESEDESGYKCIPTFKTLEVNEL